MFLGFKLLIRVFTGYYYRDFKGYTRSLDYGSSDWLQFPKGPSTQ